jgi:hypothetical protein
VLCDYCTPNGRPLASGGLSLVLALEVAVTQRQTKVALEIRQLIHEMSLANPLWGAPRMRGELLKLGIDVGQTSVAKYMARRGRPPTFLHNHADGIASVDLFVVPTIAFRLLYGLLVLRHDRREILWLSVTAHPTAGWIARQLTEAFGSEQAPSISFAIVIGPMANSLPHAFAQWAFVNDQRHRDRRGRMDMLNGGLVRSGANVLIMSWCSASDICATCCAHTCSITTTHARLFLWAKMRQSHEHHRTHSADTNSWRVTPSICSDLFAEMHH